MLDDILFAIWFLLPVAAANVTPILAVRLPGLKNLNTPLDMGKQFRGKELFGPHKTWRGLMSGMIVATMVLWGQQLLLGRTDSLSFVNGFVAYESLPNLLLGPLFGLGALGGDAVESFFKRQRGIPSGHAWVPFDQLDYVIGGIVVSLPFVIFSPGLYIWMIVFWFAAHLVASYIGWRLGLKAQPV